MKALILYVSINSITVAPMLVSLCLSLVIFVHLSSSPLFFFYLFMQIPSHCCSIFGANSLRMDKTGIRNEMKWKEELFVSRQKEISKQRWRNERTKILAWIVFPKLSQLLLLITIITPTNFPYPYPFLFHFLDNKI